LWGVLHGLFISVNHFWRDIKKRYEINLSEDNLIYRHACRLLTFTAVVFAYSWFRAEDSNSIVKITQALFSFNNMSVAPYYELAMQQQVALKYCHSLIPGLEPLSLLAIAMVLMIIWVWFAPNLIALTSKYTVITGDKPRAIPKLQWSPTIGWAALAALAAFLAIINLSSVTEFIYFQF